MSQTTARIKKGSKHFEILVDLEEAMKFRKELPGSSLASSVLTDAVFYNLKSGEKPSNEELMKAFETTDFQTIATKIIKSGEVVQTVESIRENQDKKYKQVVDFLVKSAVSPEGRPYTPDRIMKALSEAHVNIKNKPIESQINEIIDQLSKVLPLKMEKKKVKLLIPAMHASRAYGLIKEFMIEESWQDNGNLQAIIEMPTAMIFDFYDRLNSATHGSVMSEELKK